MEVTSRLQPFLRNHRFNNAWAHQSYPEKEGQVPLAVQRRVKDESGAD